MKLEQREELKAAAQRLHDARNAPLHIFNARQDEYRDLAPSFAILSLIAQVEALTVPGQAVRNAQADAIMGFALAMQDIGMFDARLMTLAAGTTARIRGPITPPTIPAIPGTKEES